MLVPVVRVRQVWMLVFERVMLVPMSMGTAGGISRAMGVLVVFVVLVQMLVCHGLVAVPV